MNAPLTCIQLDTHGVKRTLQAAIDRYPRLLALRVTLHLPDTAIQPLDVLITRFHAALRQHINAFIDIRQSEGKPAPPTQIGLLWGVERHGGIPMLLLVNQDTVYSVRHDAAFQIQIDAVNALIDQVWSSVIDPVNELAFVLSSEAFCMQVDRGDVEQYASQYAALSNSMKSLASVVCTIP
ncbi:MULTISPECIES: YagK/YfjJ domain-containing protein [unclassified Serratia (in: enterobacteria)]|uniref:YagK/YfjJ domain-containing protein n=1 Tax=unclassified Serratia (in: enterobacteria) TaxID=2647522 RepID=UPI00307620B9